MHGAVTRPNFDFDEWSDVDDDEYSDNENENQDENFKAIKKNRPKKQKIVRLTYRLPIQSKNSNTNEFDISQAMIDILEKIYQVVSSQTAVCAVFILSVFDYPCTIDVILAQSYVFCFFILYYKY